jgi:uncharacterized protein YdiU (UPF0061 family)
MEKNLISQFIENMLKEAGFSEMPEKFKEEYAAKLTLEAQTRLGAMAMKELDEKSLVEYMKMMEKQAPDLDKLQEFFQARIPDFEAKIIKVLEDFALEFKQGADKIKAAAGI